MQLKENSGILCIGASVWLHNDSGDNPYLYKVNMEGSLLKTIKIGAAKNVDWEDITQDRQGNVYIGDIGNNNNTRNKLCVYKIPNPENIDTDSVTAERIDFRYPDQKAFPPPAAYRHFDAEAMIALGDSLYIFTKNRTQPNNGWVKLYRIPSVAGSYEAILLDSLQILPGSFLQSVTGAALSPDGRKLALLSMTKIRIFSNFQGAHFFKAVYQRKIRLPFTQKEAVDFIDNKTLLISDEKSPFGRPHLYRLKLP